MIGIIIYLLGCIVAKTLHCVDFIYCTKKEFQSFPYLFLGGIVIFLMSWVGVIICLDSIVEELKGR